MTIEFPTDITRVVFAGDWHGDTSFALQAIHHAAEEGAQVILQAGDFGYNFKPMFLDSLTRAARQHELIIMFVDGNHENFDWLLAQPVSEDGVRRLTARVWHLPRGFRWNWSGVSFLALGGGVSVDKSWRQHSISWWPQETITQADLYKVGTDHADVMITHDAPTDAPVPLDHSKSWGYPEPEINASNQHRELLQWVVNDVRPKYLLHGHYHHSYEGEVNGTRYIGLGMNDAEKIKANIRTAGIIDGELKL